MAQSPLRNPAQRVNTIGRAVRPLVGLLLLGILAVLGVFQNQNRGTIPTENRLFPDLTTPSLIAINLYNTQTGISETLTRPVGGQWMLDDSEVILDPALASRIAQTLVLMTYKRTITLEPNDALENYGFNPTGELYIEFVEVDGIPHAIALGNLLPDRDEGYYALVDDRPKVYVIPRGAADFLLSQLSDVPSETSTDSP